MRQARERAGLPADGEPLVAFRSFLASAMDPLDDLSFQDWTLGDTLPAYDNHATGVPLHDDSTFAREDTRDVPPDWPRRYPYHPSFGPRSTVSVPLPVFRTPR